MPDPAAPRLPAAHIGAKLTSEVAAHNRDPAANHLPAAHIGARLASEAAAHSKGLYDLLRQERSRAAARMVYKLEHIHFLRP
ncbi:hypothetical protein KDAU_71420 [Dictyobacter aurantiacus]|uniref:Uncharacterized protein n=1 Tax=Dictyobacter aurantiacus TaxID=1936993 RepID=A0A401ZSH9_9CHLR|nr:hypothetical protein KDAU_71420 [Dictyobacter aurantiacus]